MWRVLGGGNWALEASPRVAGAQQPGDAAPMFRVHVLLGDALATAGDKQAAAAVYVAARGSPQGTGRPEDEG